MSRPVRRYWGTACNEPLPPVRLRVELRTALRRLVSRLAVGSCVVTLGWLGARELATSAAFQVREIAISGSVHASGAEIIATSGLLSQGVFTADLVAARLRLVAHPWVLDASLRRVPPHRIDVHLIERRPLARLPGGTTLIAGDGRHLPASTTLNQRTLPILLLPVPADERREQEAAATLARLAEREPAFFASVSEADARGTDRLVIHAEAAPPLLLGNPDSVDSLSGWLDRSGGIARAIGAVSQVDARWRGRVFVTRSGSTGEQFNAPRAKQTSGARKQGADDGQG